MLLMRRITPDAGETGADWTADVPDPNGGWFGNQFSLLFNEHVRASGITFCTSHDLGAAWQCGPPVDSIFDGPVFFATDLAGWVGGGEISPNVEGWVHRTTDGGKTWSARTLDVGIPIREIRFLNTQQGWAAGGNIYSNQGGIYFSKDGGQTWALDVDTAGAEWTPVIPGTPAPSSRSGAQGMMRLSMAWCTRCEAQRRSQRSLAKRCHLNPACVPFVPGLFPS